MSKSEIIQDVIKQTLELADNMDKLTVDEYKDQLVKIGAQAILRLENEKNEYTK